MNIRVDAAKELGAWLEVAVLRADEPNYALARRMGACSVNLANLPKQFIFAHNLLCTGDGTPALKWGSTGVHREGRGGTAIYD